MGKSTGFVVRATALAASMLLAVSARAQELLPFAFAYRLGSGIYAASGRSIQIYRLPFTVTLLKDDEGTAALELSLPATLGFYDFQATDILQTGLPNHVGTASFTPGLRIPVQVVTRWTLTPFAEAGPAWENEADSTTWVYGTGVESLALFPAGPGAIRWGNTLAWVGENPPDRASGSFLELDTGLEYRAPVGSIHGRRVDLGGFVENFHYEGEENEVARYAEPATRTLLASWEAGVSFGTVERAKLWKVPIPRFGISYRWNDEEGVWRIVFGSPF